MPHLETLEDKVVDEIIHGSNVARLRLRAQRLSDEEGPPIAVERTTPIDREPRATVVLVHGFAQNRYTWRLSRISMSGYLADAGYDVLNVELRGHGNSREYGAGNATAFPDYVDDLCRVLDALEEPPFVVGHSLGAAVGVAASTLRPLRGLTHLAGVYTFARFNRTIRVAARVSRRMAPALTKAPARVRTSVAGRVLGRLYRLTDVAGYTLPLAGWAPGSMPRDLLAERLELGFDWTSVEVWLEMARWAAGEPFPYEEAWMRTDVPLLVLAGDLDALVPPGDARLCFEASGSTDKAFVLFEPFEHQVHWGHLDLCTGDKAPEEVWPCIRAWMDER